MFHHAMNNARDFASPGGSISAQQPCAMLTVNSKLTFLGDKRHPVTVKKNNIRQRGAHFSY